MSIGEDTTFSPDDLLTCAGCGPMATASRVMAPRPMTNAGSPWGARSEEWSGCIDCDLGHPHPHTGPHQVLLQNSGSTPYRTYPAKWDYRSTLAGPWAPHPSGQPHQVILQNSGSEPYRTMPAQWDYSSTPLGELGEWYKPWTWFSDETPQRTAETEGLWSEVERLGATKTICLMRKFKKNADVFQSLSQLAKKKGMADVAEHCQDQKKHALTAVNFLRASANTLFDAKNLEVPTDACKSSDLKGLGCGCGRASVDGLSGAPIVAGLALADLLWIIGAVGAIGLIGYAIYQATDYMKQAQVLGYCKENGISTEDCADLITAASPPVDYAKIVKPIAVALGIGIVGYIGYRIYERREARQPRAAMAGYRRARRGSR